MIRKLSGTLFLPLVIFFISFSCALPLKDQPSTIQGAESRIFKTIGDTKLRLHIFQPSRINDSSRLPAIIFFFGGGWQGGRVTQFVPQCRYLAERGMVSIVADYRVERRQGVMPFECVADARSAVRWVRIHAAELGIDEKRIVAGGGSAGGHLAACTALINDFNEKDEDGNISSVPNALVLFNPVLDVPEIVHELPVKLVNALHDREKEISPVHHMYSGVPPTIIFHGTADDAVPFHQATRFCEDMRKYGNRCEVIPFEGLGHGFFNYYGGKNPAFGITMDSTVKFLITIGFLKSSVYEK
jgi:acetyl esterase